MKYFSSIQIDDIGYVIAKNINENNPQIDVDDAQGYINEYGLDCFLTEFIDRVKENK